MATSTPLTYNSYISQIADMAVVPTTTVVNSSSQTITVSTDSNFNVIIPEMLNYAELRIQRDLDLLSSVSSKTPYILSSGSNLLSIPTDDFITVQTVSVTNGTSKSPLLPVTKQYIQSVYNDSSYTGTPKVFSMYGGDSATGGKTSNYILVGPYANSTYTFSVSGTTRLPTLYPTIGGDGYPISGSGTTFISTYFPDLLVLASMIYISAYQRNFGRMSDDPAMAQSFEGQYQAVRQSAITEEYRKKFQGPAWTSESPSPIAAPGR